MPLSSIAITTPPTKTAYTEGETFNPAGMVVTATYSDGTTAAVNGYSTSPATALTTADTTITVSYTEDGVTATATVAITVAEPTPQPEPTPTPDWWRLESDGTLYIYCVGDMPLEYEFSPWVHYNDDVRSIVIQNSVTDIGSLAFSMCERLTSVTIPHSVTSIKSGAFDNCISLPGITIPNSVTSIGNGAFSGCGSLTAIVIPNSVTSIDDNAFENAGLVNVTIGSGVVNIGSEAFNGCNDLSDVYYDGTETQWNAITIGSGNEPLLNATIHFNTPIPEPEPEPEPTPSANWPRTALNVMEEIAARIGAPLDPRSATSEVISNSVEDTALKMTMREVIGYIAAMNGGNWTITDEGKLYFVKFGTSEEAVAEISAHNAESLSVSEPLEAWSGVRALWDGEEWDASGTPGEGERPVKKGDQIGFAGDESGRVLEVKIAFGQSATPNPSTLWNRGAERLLTAIQNNKYSPFDGGNVLLDPACEIGDAVTIPGGTSIICTMSGDLDGLCAMDVSAPPDEAINTAYPANWAKAQSVDNRLTPEEVSQIVSDAYNAAFEGD